MQISDIALLIQTVVLFITLVVLIWQTHQNTKAVRMSQYQDALKMMFEFRSDIIHNNIVPDYDADSSYFRVVFSKFRPKDYFHILKLFHTFEVFFLLHEANVIDNNMWLGWKNNIKTTLLSKGIRDIWEQVKQAKIYHPKFATFIDNLIWEIIIESSDSVKSAGVMNES